MVFVDGGFDVDITARRTVGFREVPSEAAWEKHSFSRIDTSFSPAVETMANMTLSCLVVEVLLT